jgi:hypothetical protein
MGLNKLGYVSVAFLFGTLKRVAMSINIKFKTSQISFGMISKYKTTVFDRANQKNSDEEKCYVTFAGFGDYSKICKVRVCPNLVPYSQAHLTCKCSISLKRFTWAWLIP